MKLAIKDPAMRGGLASEEVAKAYETITGRVLTVQEGRLLTYLRYSATNGGYIDTRRMNKPERIAVDELVSAGLMVRDENYKIGLTRAFFDVIGVVEWDVYCVQALEDTTEPTEPGLSDGANADE